MDANRIIGWVGTRGYRPAIVALSGAALIHFLLLHSIGITGAGVFFFYLLAVLCSAWCGVGPGLLVLTLALTVLPFFYRTGFTLRKIDPFGALALVVLCLLVSWMSNRRRESESALRDRVRVATAALEHRVAELETLYSQLSIGLCYVDHQTNVVRINRALAAMKGALASEQIGLPLAEAFNGEVAKAVRALIDRVGTGGHSKVEGELEVADQVWLLGCSAVRGESVLGFQITLQDITARKRDEQALRRANDDLTQFTYIAAHDLQEPLRNVVLFSELVQQDAPEVVNAKVGRHLNFIAENARRMSRLISDVVTYSSVSSPAKRKFETVDLNQVCRLALARLAGQLQPAQVTFAELPEVNGDQDQLVQVFAELLSNSVKFGRAGLSPRIGISAARQSDGGLWEVTVRDNGQGFAKEYGETIFGVLRRLHGADVPGSGIGLAICKAVVERHGGRIWVESVEGEGTTVSLTLPQRVAAEVRQIA